MGLVDPQTQLQETRGFVKLKKSSALICYFTRDAVVGRPCVIVRGHASTDFADGKGCLCLLQSLSISFKWMERPKLLPCLGTHSALIHLWLGVSVFQRQLATYR